MAQTTDPANSLTRFLRYTTQKQPALSVSFLAAIVLAVLAKYLHLSDDDLVLLGPIVLVVVGVVIRSRVFSPYTHELGIDTAYQEGVNDGATQLVQPADPVTRRTGQ